jgi:hypothetical protein
LRARDAEPYRTVMIDRGFCFNASEWNFPDAPLHSIYARSLVYEQARGWEAYAPVRGPEDQRGSAATSGNVRRALAAAPAIRLRDVSLRLACSRLKIGTGRESDPAPLERLAGELLENAFGPVLEEVLDLAHELVGDGTIDDAMVVA